MRENPTRTEETFWDHIFILRRYLFLSFLGVIGSAGIVHYYHVQLIDFIFRPLGDTPTVFLSPLDPFIFIFKIDFFGGLILTLPLIIIFIFLFIAPAFQVPRIWLKFSLFFVFSLLLTAGAIAYTFLILLPLSLGFLLSIHVPGVINNFTAQNYLNFVIVQLTMSIGIAFIPLIIVFLTFIHFVNPYRIGGKRGTIYISITVLLAVLSPTTDLYTLLILLTPALGMFEISIVIAKIIYQLQHKRSV